MFASTLAFAFAAPLYASERDALIHFYNATNGDTWNDHTGWLGPVGTECTWFGVNCGPDGHVVVLNLHGNGLQGPIPDLSGLTELEGLVLSQNALSGPIPDLSTLIHLKSVVLRHNNLVGAFPALNPAAPLNTIDLGINALSGPIPVLPGASTLVNLLLDYNHFSGSIPGLANLPLLERFYADGNQLSGPLPALPSSGGALEQFTVSANDLSGALPDLTTMTALIVFDASSNQLTGSLPSNFPASLDDFLVSSNEISGSMPSLAATHLKRFKVDGNAQVTGPVASGPNPDTLSAGGSALCPSGLTPSADQQIEAQWNAATGHSPWSSSGGTFCAQQAPAPVPLLSTMEFTPPAIVIGGLTQMRITIRNPNAQVVTGVAFTDSYPAGFKNTANPIGQPLCGGTLSAPAGGSSLALAGAVVAAHASCTIDVNLVGAAAGQWLNSTGSVVSSSPQMTSLPAVASIGVLAANHAPVALDDQATVVRYGSTQALTGDSRVPASVLDNDSDPDAGDFVASAIVVSFPSYGVLTLNPDGTFTYQNTGGGITDTFQYYACDTYTLCTTATVSIAITDSAGTPQSISFTSVAPTDAEVGGPIYQVSADATSNLPVALTIDASSISVCSIANGTVSFIGAGTCTIDANQPGDTTYAPALQVQQSFDVAGASGASPQSITFQSTAPTNAEAGGQTYQAIATATSGLPVTLAIDASSATVCTINAGAVTFIGAGFCTIDANQGGNAQYAPAPQEQQSFVVSAGGVTPQTIAFTSTAPISASVGGLPYLAAAGATSGLPVVLTIDGASTTVCSINAGTVTFIGAGTCTIDANQGGDAIYAPAPQEQQSFAVADASGITAQTITFTSTPPANATVAGTSYLATASASSGLPVVLAIDATSTTVCAINAGTVSFIGAGTCNINANQGGDATYLPAPQEQQSLSVASAGGVTPQTITFTSTAPTDASVGGNSYLAMATASSGLIVVLTIETASATVCAINNGTVTFIGAGTCTIDANQGGDAGYAAASEVQQSFNVAPPAGATSQTIAFVTNPPQSAEVGGTSYPAFAEASSGLPVVLTIDASTADVCVIDRDTVSFIGAGTCTIDANQGGDGTYAAAPEVQQSFAVAPASGVAAQTIAFTSTPPSNALVGGSTYLATANATSGLPVTLSIDAASIAVCAINAGTVSFVGGGTCTVDANQGGDATYAAAPEIQQAFDVGGGVGAPTITCVLPTQVASVGDAISIDLSNLFAPPAGQTLDYWGTSVPPSLSISGSTLSGTLQAADVPAPPYAWASVLHATTVPGGATVGENVSFVVLPAGELLLREGFDGPDSACQ